MQQTVDTISLASKFLNDLMANPQLYNGNGGNIEVDEMLLACAKAITDAGLISASKAVAGATNVLIHTADGVLKQSNSHEELIVASNEVAASTAQLVAASRVKANFVSQAQDNLEIASSNVSKACKSLVVKVEGLLIRKDEEGEKEKENIDLTKLTPYEGKTLEMEQQVKILKLENSILAARKRLAEIRKQEYKTPETVFD
ncbi:I/LWEQ domain family protein [Candida albicans]|uniref:I/LWEQ domain family protein n=1 Tax=Candida albicans TaxID=5476 RepID=A0A8H6BU56_CANAX|nr:I/LWEQ domain family protein [Candida albicans]